MSGVLIQGRCEKMVFTEPVLKLRQCSRRAVVDGKWCRQHDPGAVKARREKAVVKRKKAVGDAVRRNMVREEQVRDRMFEPVEGWIWCHKHSEPHITSAFCSGDHRRLWVERTGGGR